MMVRSSLQIVLFLLWFLCGAKFSLSLSRSIPPIHCNRGDREVLLQFRKCVVDPSSLLSSWSTKEDCCEWIGIQCHNITGRVSKLNLNFDFIRMDNYSLERLTGEINLCVLRLEFLNYLDLSENNFTTIRDTANDKLTYHNLSLFMPQHQNSNISTLLYLDLSRNYDLKIDQFRWLSHIPSLKYLNLRGIDLHRENDFLYSISALLPSLLELRLACCHLGSVSPFLNYVNFTSLTGLDLSGNNFNSKVFGWVFNITNSLSYLDLGWNQVDGISDTLLNNQNLEHLDLSGNKLNGTIPKWLGQFKNLQVLDLSRNSLHSSIPLEFGNLSSSQVLDFSYNSFHGSIPLEFGNLSSSQVLDFSYNSFHGSIPLELGNLSSLTDLDIRNNHLSGTLPETLHKLSSLSSLNVAGNSLGGVISESNFANLTSLKELDLRSSAFQFNVSSSWIPPFQLGKIHLGSCILGPKFPTWLYTQKSLKILSVRSTRISFVDHDKFWSYISSHAILLLDISNNSISGDISNWSLNTTLIYLASNKFKGGLPRITPSVLMFFAGNNSFSGSIAPFLCGIDNSNQHYLVDLDLSNNHLSGELPDCWMKWKHLNGTNLGGNNLTGRIPSSMGSLSSLNALDLYDNNFSGDIPLPLQQCDQLKFLILGENQFSGSIPSWIPQSIIALVLRGNKFSGNIPPNICQLSSLILLDLAENNLSGSIPECVYNLTSMKHGSKFFIGMEMPSVYSTFPYTFWFHTKGQELEYKFKFETLWRLVDVSKNNLVGPIPHKLFHLVGLVSLNLSQNHLTGKIPPEISQMKILQSLDLSMNKLSGEIPQAMSSLSFLEYLNLSFNNFIGRIPTGTQLQGFDASCYMGNLELCGLPLKNCTEEKKSVDRVSAKAEDEFLSWFYIGMGVGFATGFWGVCVALFFKRSWRHAYFRFLDNIKDQLYVKVLLIMNSVR